MKINRIFRDQRVEWNIFKKDRFLHNFCTNKKHNASAVLLNETGMIVMDGCSLDDNGIKVKICRTRRMLQTT